MARSWKPPCNVHCAFSCWVTLTVTFIVSNSTTTTLARTAAAVQVLQKWTEALQSSVVSNVHLVEE